MEGGTWEVWLSPAPFGFANHILPLIKWWAAKGARMEIRRIEPNDWEELRSVRLAAQQDSPEAYTTRYEEAVDYPDALWQERARAGSAGTDQATFLLVDGEQVCGMVTGLARPEDPVEVVLVGMWIAPAHRRAGHGLRLVERLIEWASQAGEDSVVLGVTSGNHSALTLYESCGFILTGERHDLPGHSALIEPTMRLQLSR